ncbi:DUF6088 family protein [Caballeronia sp. S22]|uniref:DUF6088 family protein n=1 Tax=Caballeronia sp. S22 TaxID=3137182 RepID=UPI003530E2E2
MNGRRVRKLSVEKRLLCSIRRRHGVVILRSDFSRFGSASQVSRALAKLVAAGVLIRVGHGLYAKTRVNSFTGRSTPASPFESIAAEAFRRLGIVVGPGKLAREYNSGQSTQIPMQPIVSTGKRRISRRIEVGSKKVIYERAPNRTAKGRSCPELE